jgi:FkbM family methyltransferase
MLTSLKRLSYRPEVIRPLRKLGLSSILRRAYFYCARPKGGIIQTEIAGIQARFYTHTPEDLRILESAGGAGGEQRVLSRLIDFLRPGDVAFDIGANVGLYTVLLAKTVGGAGRVVAFEPDHRAFDHLRDNLKLNGIANARCFRQALGEQAGQARLYASKIIGGSSLVAKRKHGGGGQIVAIAAGDDLVLAEKVPLPRAVKIDVEGYEHSVIRGLSRTLVHPACEVVCCEVHPSMLPKGVRPEQILDLLQSLGFARREIYRRWDSTFHLIATKGPH